MRPSDVPLHRRMTRDVLAERYRQFDDDVDDWDGYRWALEALGEAQLYYVSRDMSALARSAAPTLPGEHLLAGELPADSGLMLYDDVIGRLELADGVLPVRGYLWHVVNDHSEIYDPETACDRDDMCDSCANFGRLTPAEQAQVTDDDCRCRPCDCVACTPIGYGRELWIWPMVEAPGIAVLTPFQLGNDYGPMSWVTGGGVPCNDWSVAGDGVVGLADMLRTTWVMMQQTVAAVRPQHADRAERRRSARAGVPSTLTVVLLRRQLVGPPEPATTGDPYRDWSHRWLVDGHWRNQACGPGMADRRPTWIFPHVKGPVDKPLVLKERVRAWVR